MSKVNIILFLLFPVLATAQEATMFSLKGYGGNAIDQIGTHVTKTQDGGFVLRLNSGSTSGIGNLDSFCVMSGAREVFLKYNSDASILEWSKCYGDGGDSFLLYPYPVSDGIILGGEFNANTAPAATDSDEVLRLTAGALSFYEIPIINSFLNG